MKKFKSIMGKLFVVLMLAIILVACGMSKKERSIQTVKNGSLAMYPDYTIGEVLKSEFKNIKWKSKMADDGDMLVSFIGRHKTIGSKFKIDFTVDDDYFEVVSIETKGEKVEGWGASLLFAGLVAAYAEEQNGGEASYEDIFGDYDNGDGAIYDSGEDNYSTSEEDYWHNIGKDMGNELMDAFYDAIYNGQY